MPVAGGEDLLIDTGYYKPDATNNPLTMDAPSHNVILVDGVGAPKRGLLNAWGVWRTKKPVTVWLPIRSLRMNLLLDLSGKALRMSKRLA